MPNIVEIVTKKRLDALYAKHLHIESIKKLNRKNLLVDVLAICVPLLYVPVRFLAKDSTYHRAVESVWEILAAILVTLTVLKLILSWQKKVESHNKQLGENIAFAGQAEQLLLSPESLSADSVRWFLTLADNHEKSDRELLGEPAKNDRQPAYVKALKELYPGDTSISCPVCHSSPYHFKPGSCDACGNTPTNN